MPPEISDSDRIKNWPLHERPRERLLREGAQVLSDAELVAVLLRNGTRGREVMTFSRELIRKFGGLRGLFSAGWAEMRPVKGLGAAKASALLAVNEIARRKLREELIGRNFIRDPQSVLDYLYTTLRDRKQEVFKVIFLNKGNCVLEERDLFQGTVDETAIHTREVVRAALGCHATALVLVHNHPSGRIQPSEEDKDITRKLQAACATVGIRILDHLIVGDNRYFSFSEHHLMGG